MDSPIDDKVEFLATLFGTVWLVPVFIFIVLGALIGVGMLLWSFSSKSKPLTIDNFGLVICCALLLNYFFMPIGLELNDRKEPLDVMRHGYFSVADIYTWIVFCLVNWAVFLWALIRIFSQRKTNFGVSLFLYAVINLAAIFIGWSVASEYGGAWTS